MAARSALLALGVAVLLLTGCATPTPVPPGATDAEAEEVAVQAVADYWAASRHQVPFPDVTPVRFVPSESWTLAQVSCLVAAGLPAYEISAGFAVDGLGALSPQEAELAQITCLAEYPVDPRESGYLSDAQVLYMYDYFTQRLAPCLELLGVPVSEAPDRYQYIGRLRAGEAWTPYDALGPLAPWQAINSRCPPLPVDPYSAYQPAGAG